MVPQKTKGKKRAQLMPSGMVRKMLTVSEIISMETGMVPRKPTVPLIVMDEPMER